MPGPHFLDIFQSRIWKQLKYLFISDELVYVVSV